MKPVITFDGYRINKLNYNRIEMGDGSNEISEENFTRHVSIGITGDKEKAVVILDVMIKDPNHDRIIECEVVGEFSVNKDLDASKIEEALSINGVALVYPYVRTIISMVTTLDSDSAIVIPTINTKVFEQED